jgi:hypothetical protein
MFPFSYFTLQNPQSKLQLELCEYRTHCVDQVGKPQDFPRDFVHADKHMPDLTSIVVSVLVVII